MAAEICLSKLPQLIADPNAEFQVFYSSFSTSRNINSFCVLLLLISFSFKPAKSVFYGTTDGFRSVARSWLWGQETSWTVTHSTSGKAFCFYTYIQVIFFVKPSLTLYPRYPSLCCYSFNLVKFNIHIPLFNHKKTLILGCVQPAYQKFDVICSGVHRDLTFENVKGRFVPKHIPIIIYFYYSL